MQTKQLSSSWKARERSDSIFLKEESRIYVIEPKGKKKTSQNVIQVVFITTHSSFSGVKNQNNHRIAVAIFFVSLFFT